MGYLPHNQHLMTKEKAYRRLHFIFSGMAFVSGIQGVRFVIQNYQLDISDKHLMDQAGLYLALSGVLLIFKTILHLTE